MHKNDRWSRWMKYVSNFVFGKFFEVPSVFPRFYRETGKTEIDISKRVNKESSTKLDAGSLASDVSF